MRTTRTGGAITGVALMLAACGGGGGDVSADEPDAAAPAAAPSASIEVEAGDLYYEQESLAATVGEIAFTYYCSIPGHRTSMEGALEVS